MRVHLLPRPPSLELGAVAILVAANLALGAALTISWKAGLVLALVPVVVFGLGSLVASNRAVLLYAAVGLGLLQPLPVTRSFLVGPIQVYPSDVIVVLAVASWAAAWLVGREQTRPTWLRTGFGWPTLLFGFVLLAAIVRGHYRYGASLFSFPLRLLLYAGIAAALVDLEPRKAYRGLVAVFYAGTVWQTAVAVHDLLTGTAATAAVGLSTGGDRVLAGSTAMYMAGALLLALLNVEADRRAGRAALHLAMAALATFTLVVTFQRTTFALLALLIPVFFLVYRTLGGRLTGFLPLLAPFVVLAALLIPRADPQLFPTLVNRVTASPSSDTSVRWREGAISAVWAQVRQAPVTGVGFGRDASFTLNGVVTTITQDPHDQYLYLWAGGGLALLGSFILLLTIYVRDSWRRFRAGTLRERRLVFWSVSLWFVFVVNAATGIVLTEPELLLMFWILMFLPMIVRDGQGRAVAI